MSYTSKYVGVLEGDLGVLSVKLPLRSLVELRTASNGSSVRRPSSAPMGTIGAPTVALTAAATRGVVANGAPSGQSATAIVHGSFAPRALRVCPKQPQMSASRHDVAAAAFGESRLGGLARARQAQSSKDSGYMVHSAVGGSRLAHVAQRLDDDDRPQAADSHRVRVQRLDGAPEGLDATMENRAEPSAARMAAGMSDLSDGGAAPEAATPHELYLRYVRVKKALAQEASS